VPRTFDALAGAMRGFVGFAVCFCLLSMVWHDHYLFFRHYGLRDPVTLALNLTLLFVVMFYVYPLKFLFTLLAGLTTGVAPQGGTPIIRVDQVPSLMIIYGLGFMAVHAVFALMHANAWRQRDSLGLNILEEHDTKALAGSHVMLVGIGLLSVGVAYFGGPRFAAISGMTYFLIGIGMGLYWSTSGNRRRKVEKVYIESDSLDAEVNALDDFLE
jgi:hypothetical protein